jgi:ribosomal small subunit protein bTHX
MGKGDKKTKKGKISKGSFGVSRSKDAIKARFKRVNSKKKVAVEGAGKPKKTSRKKADA